MVKVRSNDVYSKNGSMELQKYFTTRAKMLDCFASAQVLIEDDEWNMWINFHKV